MPEDKGAPEKKCLDESSFINCDSASVFKEVAKRLQTSENRSLWQRLEKELADGGVGAVDTYIRSGFQELTQTLKGNIDRFKESLGE